MTTRELVAMLKQADPDGQMDIWANKGEKKLSLLTVMPDEDALRGKHIVIYFR